MEAIDIFVQHNTINQNKPEIENNIVYMHVYLYMLFKYNEHII